MSLGDAFSASRTATRRAGSYALPVVLCVVVGAPASIACVIGLLVTEPLAYIAVGVPLPRRDGQQVAAP